MVDLTENSHFVEDLVDSSGVSELDSFDCSGGSVVESGFENFAEAAGTEKVVLREIVGCPSDFFDGEDFCGFTAAIVGV